MIKELKNNMILYHGSDTIVDNIDLSFSKVKKDFGKGFYVTLTVYLNGGYGVSGSKVADETVINILLPNKLPGQYCFKTKKSIDCLSYLKSEKV